MKRTVKTLVFCFIALGCCLIKDSRAELSSDNYRITTSVISEGGGKVESSSFLIDGTLGQSTPLMDQTDPPFSFSYFLYPGYWYANDSILSCAGDTEPDGDVDGEDLAFFAYEADGGTAILSISDFAAMFGTIDCQ